MICDLCLEYYELIQERFQNLDEEQQAELISFFDERIEDADLGTLLFGDEKDDFNDKVLNLDDSELDAFKEACEEAELL